METLTSTQRPQGARSPQVSLSEVVRTTLTHWQWIALSVVICVGLAALYLAMTPNVYTRTAALEIKDDESGATSSALAAFADMGLSSGNTNMYNEMAYLESPDLMKKVVKRLKLDIAYTMREGLKNQPLYGATLPVTVSFPTLLESNAANVKVHVAPGGKITLSNLKLDKEKYDFDMKKPVGFGTPVKTPIGVIIVDKTPYYDPEEDYDINVSRATLQGAVAAWTKKLSVTEQKKDATVIDLTIADASAQKAEDILNALIDAYNEQWVVDKNQIAVATSNFINERLAVIESELGTVDQDIASYKKDNMIPDVVQTAQLYLTENQETAQQLLALNNQLQMTRYLREYMLKHAANDKVLPANSGIENLTLEKQIADYNTQVLQRNTLAANSSVSNPVISDLDAALGSMRNAILSSIDNQIKALSTDISNLQGSQGRLSARIADSPTQAKYLLSVERQQKVKESLYLYLLQKREENELNQAFTAYNTRIITSPTGLPKPTSPRKAALLALAFVFGCFIPFGYNYVALANNTRVRSRNDLKSMSAPFLGELPSAGGRRKDNGPRMMVQSGNRNLINEAFRVVRTNLNFVIGEDKEKPGARTIMVTSFNPGSGKSFITMNLGMALAVRGNRVLVMDCDLRRGTSGEYLGNLKEGLSQFLAGKIKNIDDVIHQWPDQPNLSVIPAGVLPPNPTELVENGRLNKVVDELKSRYDYILFDCPPMDMVGDAKLISKLVERTIVVVRAGLFERSMIPELEKLYSSRQFPGMVVLLNDVKAAAFHSGYGSYGNKNYYTS